MSNPEKHSAWAKFNTGMAENSDSVVTSSENGSQSPKSGHHSEQENSATENGR